VDRDRRTTARAWFVLVPTVLTVLTCAAYGWLVVSAQGAPDFGSMFQSVAVTVYLGPFCLAAYGWTLVALAARRPVTSDPLGWLASIVTTAVSGTLVWFAGSLVVGMARDGVSFESGVWLWLLVAGLAGLVGLAGFGSTAYAWVPRHTAGAGASKEDPR
jgi:hypothetical protein